MGIPRRNDKGAEAMKSKRAMGYFLCAVPFIGALGVVIHSVDTKMEAIIFGITVLVIACVEIGRRLIDSEQETK
jgi:hypothetical protein